MKKVSTLILFVIIVFTTNAQESLIIDKVKPFSWNSTVPAMIFRSSTTAANLPLVIFMHGAGEKGSNGAALWNQGLPKALKDGFRPPFPCIIVAPQFTSWPPATTLPYILQDIVSRFSIDTTRVYITGLSAGGVASWNGVLGNGQTFANKIAAIVPLSSPYADVIKANIPYLKTSKTSIWAITGDTGSELSFKEGNENLVKMVNAAVPNLAKMTVIKGAGHCCWWVNFYNGTWKDADGQTFWSFIKDKKQGGGTIIIQPQPPIITVPVPFDIIEGNPFEYQIKTTGLQPITYTANNLPSGMALYPNGLISGTANVNGTFNVTVTATNKDGNVSANLVFVITPKPKRVRMINTYIDNSCPTCSYRITYYEDGTYEIDRL